ncbi:MULTISPECIES: hypothetical protein [unclassified Streptomyces]|uniref:hypothetical protein n=1 Tax=unclassified Streptomyces TaxID=2593676 RepID=UPI0012FF377E|nr:MULTISPECIES: hypothetical protein [unclassified Streptomyces]
MTSGGTTTCTHPVRDLAIVSLSAVLAALSAIIVVLCFKGSPLDAFKAGGGAFIAIEGVGLAALQHLKRN